MFEQGYGLNIAQLAKTAQTYATENEYDVLIIDTAGRMQNNKTLMNDLCELIRKVHCDISLFIGEGLVGSASLNQVEEFQTAFSKAQVKEIDGLIVTKIDTLDNQVGTIINMCYKLRKPVFFIGTGQKYEDLHTIDVS